MSVKQRKRVLRNPLVKRKNLPVLKKLGLALSITVLAALLYAAIAGHTYEAKQQVKLQQTYIQLQKTRNDLLHVKASGQQEQQKQTQQIQQLDQQLQSAQQQLSAKKANDAAVAYAAALPTSYHSDNWYMDFIFQHESSNNPQAINEIGACGLGQSLPCSKLSGVCGWPAGVDCQVQWFSNYAVQRYGSWQNAYYYWINHGNW